MHKNPKLAVSAFFIIVSGCTNLSQPVVPKIPRASEIKQITAELFNLPFPEERLEPFDVPLEYYSSLLSFLEPPIYNSQMDERLISSYQVGKLLVLDTHGSTLEICLVWCGKNSATFTLNKVPCMRGGEYRPVLVEDEFEGFADEVLGIASFLIAVQQEDSQKAQSQIGCLNKSAGRELAVQLKVKK